MNLAGKPPLGLKLVKPESGTAKARAHMGRIAELPCVVCGACPVEVHHCISDRFGSRKAGDFETIPLCVAHHRIGPEAIHQNKAAWETANGKDHEYLPVVADMLAGQFNPIRGDKWVHVASAARLVVADIGNQGQCLTSPKKDMSGPAPSILKMSRSSGAKPSVTLPWFPKGLSPNHRPHWSAKAKATSSYRFSAKVLAIEAGWQGNRATEIEVTFCPKSLGPLPDMDNCIAAFKSGQDGLACALGINDRDLNVTYAMGERCKAGAVIVKIKGMKE